MASAVALVLKLFVQTKICNRKVFSDVRYVSKYRDTPGVSGYDTAILVYRYFYKFEFSTI